MGGAIFSTRSPQSRKQQGQHGRSEESAVVLFVTLFFGNERFLESLR
jgi:hypothetical protein